MGLVDGAKEGIHTAEAEAVERGPEEVPPVARAGADGQGTRHESQEAGRQGESQAATLETTVASIHRVLLRETVWKEDTGRRPLDRKAGCGEVGSEEREETLDGSPPR